MIRSPKTLSIILALLMGPCLMQAQLSYEPTNLLEEKEVSGEVFSSPSPINIKEVQTAIQYPEKAQEAGLEGLVICKILVDKHGKYMRHRVIKSPGKSLREAVSPHLARLRFVPAVKNDIAIAAWTTVQFAFRLTEDFSAPKPGRSMQIEIWEQAAEAQIEVKEYHRALELYEKAITLQNNQVPNGLLDKAAQAAILAENHAQARVHLTNLLYQTDNTSEKARVLFLRAQNADIQGDTALSVKDQIRANRLAPGFIPDEQDIALFASLSKK